MLTVIMMLLDGKMQYQVYHLLNSYPSCRVPAHARSKSELLVPMGMDASKSGKVWAMTFEQALDSLLMTEFQICMLNAGEPAQPELGT